MVDFSELKRKHRATWASGDYDQIARGVQPVADHVVRCARVRAGERVLDIACGTGNAAIVARARGAVVTGLDLTPELLVRARERAAEEEVDDISWEEGDAEALPFPDHAFDVVLSSCGLMFAPDHAQVAREVARVTKSGGRIAIQAWSPDSGVARMFQVTARHVPPPVGVASPFEWGTEAAVTALLGPSFREHRFVRYDCPEYADAPEQLSQLFIDQYGPTHRAYHSLSPEQARAYRQDLTTLFGSYVTPADGKVRWGREYLITLATRV